MTADGPETPLDEVLTLVRACRICRDEPAGRALPHAPRPVFQAAATARVLIAGQAPGTRVHESGRPFTDPSGDRLRRWLNLAPEVFYDATRVAILPMGFCYPGQSPSGGDLPPRRECAPAWRGRILSQLANLRLIVTLGLPAARWHLEDGAKASLEEMLRGWQAAAARPLPVFVLPHPSWRNNALLSRHPWIEGEIVPALQKAMVAALA